MCWPFLLLLGVVAQLVHNLVAPLMPTAKIDLTLLPEGRHLTFSKELLEVAHLFRRVGGEAGPWQRVAVNTRSPYLDADVFSPGTKLEYYVQHETQQGEPESHSPIVSTTLP